MTNHPIIKRGYYGDFGGQFIPEMLRRNFEELWSQGNLDVADEIVSSDFVLHDPFGPVNGPDAYKQMALSTDPTPTSRWSPATVRYTRIS